MTDITPEHVARLDGLISLAEAAIGVLTHGVARFVWIKSALDESNPMSATLMWEENVIVPHQAEYQAKLAELRAIVAMFPEEIA